MIKFSIEECKDIIELSNVLERVKRDEYPRAIKYDYFSIGWNKDTDWIFNRMNEYFTSVTGIKVIKNLDAIHLFDYKVGDCFTRHRDIYYDNQIYNIGVCLNDNYIGGDFILYEPEYKVLPKETGVIYTFNHAYEHEVLKVTEGHRWSLIGFYFYEHLDIKKSVL